MNNELYSLRCQDMHNAIHTNVDPTSGYLTDYKSTRIIGMAGQVISTIHGMDVVDYEKFEPLASHQYGIDQAWLEKVFNVLQECDLVNIIGKKNNPEKIFVKSKYLKSNYEILSEHLIEDMSPKELEISTIDILQKLSITPLTTDDIKSSYNLNNSDITRLVNFGTESQLLQFTQVNQGNSIVSTPMYWDENAVAAHEIIKSFSPQVFIDAMNKVKKYQGFPVDITQNQVMSALVSKGILPTPIIRMDGKDHPFLFTPYNTTPSEKIILEKARDILACVRCGENFAKYPIRSPKYILNTLKDSSAGYKLRPTTVAKEQYFLLASKGIGLLDPSGNDWYSFRLIDTPDNIRAVNLAIELLENGELVERTNDSEEEIRQFLGTRGTCISPYKSIKEANKKKDISPDLAKELIGCINGAYTYKGVKNHNGK